MSEDENIRVTVTHDSVQKKLKIRLTAKTSITVAEWQGRKLAITDLGITRPSEFKESYFGESVQNFDAVKDDMAVINQHEFRWKCTIQLEQGQSRTIEISAPGPGGNHKKGDLLTTFVYEYKKFFGLIKKKTGIRVQISSSASA